MEDNIRERQLLEAENQRLVSFVKIGIYPTGLYRSVLPMGNKISMLLEEQFDICHFLLIQFTLAGASDRALREELTADRISMIQAFNTGIRLGLECFTTFCATENGRPLRSPQ